MPLTARPWTAGRPTSKKALNKVFLVFLVYSRIISNFYGSLKPISDNNNRFGAKAVYCVVFLISTIFLDLRISGIQSAEPVNATQNVGKPVKSSLEPAKTYDNWIGAVPALNVSGPEQTEGRISIMNLHPGGPAAQAGLKESDYLVSINGRKLKSHADFSFIVSSFAPGTVVDVTFERANEINTTKLRIARRPHLPDLVNQKAPVLNVESYTDEKTYSIPRSDQKIKIFYFMIDLFNTRYSDPFPEFKKHLDAAGMSDIAIYGITVMTCESTKFVYQGETDSRIKHVECKEKRLAKEDKRAYEIFYESRRESEKLYFVEARPSIAIIDKENIIRYADILTDKNIPKAIQVLRNLK